MKRCILISLLLVLLLCLPSCSKLILDMAEITDQDNEPGLAQNKKTTVLTMHDLMVIKLAGDYLKKNGESVEFDETEMILHYEHNDSVYLPVIHGKHVEYSEPYLEVIMYEKKDTEGSQCHICYIVYMTEGGEVLGYNKVK